jgi:hypothetical protein
MRLKNFYKAMVPEDIRDQIHVLKVQAAQSYINPITLLKVLQDPDLLHQEKRLASLKGKYTGKRCFIMGSGPSLNQMDLGLLKDEYVWGSNRIYLLFDRIEWRPKFYVAVDTRVVPDNAAEINQLSTDLPGTLFFFPVQFRLQGILSSKKNVYWFHEAEKFKSRLPEDVFSLDAAKQVSRVKTVTIAALQMAVYLGFNPIYLIGCDTSYSIPPTVDYEDEKKILIVSQQNDDPNHFAPNYFGAGRKWHDPKVENMIAHYAQAQVMCNRVGVKVYNATVGGKLEVFERVDYRDLLLTKK